MSVTREQEKGTENSVLAVLVLYERKIDYVASWNILTDWFTNDRVSKLNLQHILIYDNSKSSSELKSQTYIDRITYKHNPTNEGTAAAYVYGSELAASMKLDWILLLDQDTLLPVDYLAHAGRKLESSQDGNIAALVPYVRHDDFLVSPAQLTRSGSVRPLKRNHLINSRIVITAISSGALFQVDAMKSLMPFPKRLWLDYVDHWMFFCLSRLKWTVLVFDSTIDHHLSIKSLSDLNPNRIESILDGELLLAKCLGKYAKLLFPIRIIKRIFLYMFQNHKLAIAIIRWAATRANWSHQ